MLKIHTLVLGLYQTNCYIIHDDSVKNCCIIDPGYDADKILTCLKENGLTAEAILLTHGHFDHVGAVKEIIKKTGCKLWMNEGDWSQDSSPVTSYLYPIANCNFTEVQFCEDMQIIFAGGLHIQVFETPGHTYGSVCYWCENALFTGDTLFADSCGRTDLPGGDSQMLRQSLKWLARHERDYAVYPGHGESTTLAAQKQYNPYLR